MGSFSMTHWIVVLAVVVLLFGAKKIPELAKGVGQGIKDFKNAIKENDDTSLSVMQTEVKIDVPVVDKIYK